MLSTNKKFALLRPPPVKYPSKLKMQITALKDDLQTLLSAMYCMSNEDGDLDTFFMHENQSTSPSLSLGGKIRLGTKVDLLHCLELVVIQEANTLIVNANFFGGTAVVQMLHPGTAKIFQDYADAVFTPYMYSQLESVEGVVIVWDVYVADSMKSRTRQKRGIGVRRRVALTTAIP